MKIYNTSEYSEKLKIRAVDVAKLSNPSKIFSIPNAVTDIDENVYDGIQINGKLWMASNLRTTHLSDGSELSLYDNKIPEKTPCMASSRIAKAKRDDYGLFYNFYAVDTGMLAPKGWHVPTYEEWEDMLTYVAKQKEYNIEPEIKRPFDAVISKSLCSTDGWKKSALHSDCVGLEPEKNNSTGFSIYPAGFYSRKNFETHMLGACAYFWTSTKYKVETDKANFIFFRCVDSFVRTHVELKSYGFSVRCVKD